MKGFRNICFIHSDEDSYQVCYLKQFFKWIGLSYFSYVPENMGGTCDILKRPENRDFDIVVSVNQAVQSNDREIADMFAGRFISFDFQRGVDKTEMIDRLMDAVYETALSGNRSTIIDELLDIYKKFDMAGILYEYTSVLLDQADDALFTAVFEKYEKIIDALSSLESGMDTAQGMMEYFLYAKYSCQRKMNELYDLQDWIFKYDAAEMIQQMNQIYQYDPEFYRVEYLKAKTAELDLMERVRAKSFFYKCIQMSTIEVCKSYLYYQLGKWQDEGMQIYDAEKSYERSYECNPTNIKAVFKMAVYAKKIRDRQTEIRYLQMLINSWENRQNQKHMVPLMELEYAYKSYMLMDDVSRTSIEDDKYYSKAVGILDFVKELSEKADDTFFIKNLYDPNTMGYVCQAVKCRMDIRCKY